MNKPSYEKLDNCLNCEHIVGVHVVFDKNTEKVDHVICGYRGVSGICLVMPANDVENIENGIIVVHCCKE